MSRQGPKGQRTKRTNSTITIPVGRTGRIAVRMRIQDETECAIDDVTRSVTDVTVQIGDLRRQRTEPVTQVDTEGHTSKPGLPQVIRQTTT
jgi:hypothetical protein